MAVFHITKIKIFLLGQSPVSSWLVRSSVTKEEAVVLLLCGLKTCNFVNILAQTRHKTECVWFSFSCRTLVNCLLLVYICLVKTVKFQISVMNWICWLNWSVSSVPPEMCCWLGTRTVTLDLNTDQEAEVVWQQMAGFLSMSCTNVVWLWLIWMIRHMG